MNPTAPFALRGILVDTEPAPSDAGQPQLRVVSDGALVIEAGRIAAAGDAATVLRGDRADLPIRDYSGYLLLPGLVDSHSHYPQTDIIASYGSRLLEWLQHYTFPAEARFADPAVARETAAFFLTELFRNGTTTANVLATTHAHSADAIFEAARASGMRLIAGKVMMDRNCPETIRDTAESGYRESRELLERWHGVDRLRYAITPRFAPTSSEAQLTATGRLVREFPDAYLHTHLAENPGEVAWVAELFPWSSDYLAVYDHYGLVRQRSLFAHCIHLSDADRQRMAETGAATLFCPTANTFLGSGLIDYARTREQGVRVGLGTDVGAGTSFNMLRTAGEAYKVSCLNGTPLAAASLLHLVTRGGAEALDLHDCIGALESGMEADIIAIDPGATALTARRTGHATVAETVFALCMLGDDRHVSTTWVAGEVVHERPGCPTMRSQEGRP
ncbi:MAG: guanine deaminase [Ectothiorhodospiraceae bacterium]